MYSIFTYCHYSHPEWKRHIFLVTVCLPEDVCVEAALLVVEGVQRLVLLQVQLAGVGARLVDGGARGHVYHRAVHYLTHDVFLFEDLKTYLVNKIWFKYLWVKSKKFGKKGFEDFMMDN